MDLNQIVENPSAKTSVVISLATLADLLIRLTALSANLVRMGLSDQVMQTSHTVGQLGYVIQRHSKFVLL